MYIQRNNNYYIYSGIEIIEKHLRLISCKMLYCFQVLEKYIIFYSNT